MVRIKGLVPISISTQLKLLNKYYPRGKTVLQTYIRLVWVVDIIPTPNSSTYRIKVDYTVGFNPEVFVVSPKRLKMPVGAVSLPHVYNSKKQQLCLFMPRFGEWKSHDFLAKKIVPWASEWLAFYELWLLTGEWKGEGLHPHPNKSKRKIKFCK